MDLAQRLRLYAPYHLEEVRNLVFARLTYVRSDRLDPDSPVVIDDAEIRQRLALVEQGATQVHLPEAAFGIMRKALYKVVVGVGLVAQPHCFQGFLDGGILRICSRLQIHVPPIKIVSIEIK